MRIFKSIFLLIAVAMTAACCNGTSQIITVKDGQFVKNGKPYYFIGTNMWYATILASEGEGGNRERLARELDSLKALGIDNLRILVGADGDSSLPCKVEPMLQTAPGVYNDTLLRGLDYLLVEMGKRDMQAVLYLNNSWEWSGGYSQYLTWAGYGKAPIPRIDGYSNFETFVGNYMKSDTAKNLYFNHLKNIVSRTNTITGKPYSEDPAIFSWQIANEPRPFGKENKELFAQWIAESASIIKSIDPNHMVSIGSEGKYGCQVDIQLWKELGALDQIDYMNIHIWPHTWRWVSKEESEPMNDIEQGIEYTFKYIDEHLLLAKEVGKPLTLEEFGYPRDGFSFSTESTTAARDIYYDNVMKFLISQAQNGGTLGGCNFWAWSGSAKVNHLWWEKGDDYTGDPAQEEQGLYSVFLSDRSTIKVIKSNIEELHETLNY